MHLALRPNRPLPLYRGDCEFPWQSAKCAGHGSACRVKRNLASIGSRMGRSWKRGSAGIRWACSASFEYSQGRNNNIAGNRGAFGCLPPNFSQTPRPDDEAAPKPEGPDGASRQSGGVGFRRQVAARRLDTEHTRAVRAGVKNPQARLRCRQALLMRTEGVGFEPTSP